MSNITRFDPLSDLLSFASFPGWLSRPRRVSGLDLAGPCTTLVCNKDIDHALILPFTGTSACTAHSPSEFGPASS